MDESVVSPMYVFTTPIFPLSKPFSERKSTAVKRFHERPKRRAEMREPKAPISKMGLRP